MTDDPNEGGRQDQAPVRHDDYDVENLAQKFGVSPAKVRQAELAVGKSRQMVEKYLLSRK